MFSVALLLVAFIGAEASWEDGNDGTDRPGGDLTLTPMILNPTAVPRLCAQLCAATDLCVAWSFVKPGCEANVTEYPLCWLKGKLTSQVLNTCRVCVYV